MKIEIQQKINEAKDVTIYKKLITTLSYWTEKFPMTGVDMLLDAAIDKGKSILPKDKRALSILFSVLSNDSPAAAVSSLLNTRFADLPPQLKPLAKIGKRHELAFWNAGGRVTDLIKQLINFEGDGSKGFFCDMDGNKVSLLDFEDDENTSTKIQGI